MTSALRSWQPRGFVDNDRLKLRRFQLSQDVHHCGVQPDVHVHVSFGRLLGSLDGCQLFFKLRDRCELVSLSCAGNVIVNPPFSQGAIQWFPFVGLFLKSGLRALQHVGGVLFRHIEACAKIVDDVTVWMTIHQRQFDERASCLGFCVRDFHAWRFACDVGWFIFARADAIQVDGWSGLRLQSARHPDQHTCSVVTGQVVGARLTDSEH